MGGWHSRLYSGTAGYMVAHKILVSAPVPFWVNWGWNWVGLGWDWLWGDWGLGLDNFLAPNGAQEVCLSVRVLC